MHYLLPRDLVTTALVCRDWLPTARMLLYRHIYFNTSSPLTAQLESSLRSSPHLRILIRHLVLIHYDYVNDGLLEWIALLPEHSLVSVKFERMPFDGADPRSLLQFPAVRTADEIIISHPHFLLRNPERLSDIFSNSFLSRLTLFIPKSLPLRLVGPLKLNRLSIAIWTEDRPQLLGTILESITSPLHHLDLLLSNLRPETISWLNTILERHLPTLKRLIIRALDRKQTAPFFDGMIASLVSLEVLACGPGTYTSRLFNQLPTSLRSLTLDTRDNEPFSVSELREAVTRLRSRSTAFKSMTIGRHPSYASHRYFDTLSQACASLGVSFVIMKPRLGDYLLGN